MLQNEKGYKKNFTSPPSFQKKTKKQTIKYSHVVVCESYLRAIYTFILKKGKKAI